MKKEVRHFTDVREEVRRASGDYIDLKQYEPAMRHLIDAYGRVSTQTANAEQQTI